MLNVFFKPIEIDLHDINAYIQDFIRESNQGLIELYNDINAFFGVRQQMRYTYAIHCCFLKRFGKSPFVSDSENVYQLNGKIKLVGHSWEFADEF